MMTGIEEQGGLGFDGILVRGRHGIEYRAMGELDHQDLLRARLTTTAMATVGHEAAVARMCNWPSGYFELSRQISEAEKKR